jgi:hypothetical protein
MTRLFWCEIADGIPMPEFGGEFHAHMAGKRHPDGLRRSISAWKMLETALREQGFEALPEVCFCETGKPYFAGIPLHFSLSHSGNLAAVILGEEPCAVDIEQIQTAVSEKLYTRCMHPEEIEAGYGFFEAWTKKECIAKLDGSGMPAHPREINTLDPRYDGRFFIREICDSSGNKYMLSALCEDAGLLSAEKRTIIEG